MNTQQNQLIKLLISSSEPAWKIEAIHNRCCIFYGLEDSEEKCKEIIDFANMANIGLLESFRFHVELELLKAHK